jgi:hypothetical protein
MAVNLSPVGGVAAQFFTNTGAVLTGGKIYTYSAGTTTPAVAYTSSAGNVAWSNPIVLDAAGRVSGSGEIWLTDGVNYKFVLKDSNDVLIGTYDNVANNTALLAYQAAVASPSGSSLVGFKSASANGVPITVETHLRSQYVNVFDFMTSAEIADVQSGNKTLNVRTAIQNAFDYANSLLKISQAAVGDLNRFAIKGVYFPHGVYRIDTGLNISGYSIIYGDEARVEQSTVTEDIFSSGQINPISGAYIDGAAYFVEIYGVTFFGGRRHIVLANNNLDANQLRIQRCSFFNSGSFAIDVVATSGQLKIDECKFSNNYRLARLANDMKEFSDCWFDGAKANTANTTQIINSGGTLYFYRCLGLPGTQLSAAWVADYQNHVQMYNCRWGDEGGNGGWPLIHAFGSPDSSTRYSPSIVIRDCYTGGGLNSGRADGSLVYCTYPAVDGIKRVPPIIIIDNVTKVSSSFAIGTNLTDGEFNVASNLHTGLTYYSVNAVQQETFGISASVPTPVKQRSLRRKELDLSSTAGTNQNLFRHFITQQMLANQNSFMKIRYSGTVANNANAKSILIYLTGINLSTLAYSPATSAATTFYGEIDVYAPNEYNLTFTHRVTDTTGVKVVSVENVALLNIINTEYYVDINTNGASAGDIVIRMIDVEINL